MANRGKRKDIDNLVITLLTNKTIVSRFKSINPCDISTPSDKRGKHSPANKTNEAVRIIQNHI